MWLRYSRGDNDVQKHKRATQKREREVYAFFTGKLLSQRGTGGEKENPWEKKKERGQKSEEMEPFGCV